MVLKTRVNLTPPTRPAGGLLRAARPVPDGWGRGVTFTTTSCVGPFTVGTCPDGPGLKPAARPSGPHEFASFTVGAALECSTLGRDYSPEIAAQETADVIREFAVARELLTGDASARDAGPGEVGNVSLAGDVTHTLSSGGDVETALACIEQVAAETLFGRQVFVHMPPAVAVVAAAARVIRREGARWLTPSDSIVVVSPGYDGRAPGTSAPASSYWIYATGEVYATTGSRTTTQDVDRSVNTDTARTEDQAVAVFDPCFVAAADSGVSVCAITSP